MSYQVDYQSGGSESNPSITGKASIALPTSVVDTTSTSLTLTGKGVPNYGEIQQENFIRLLENFASKNAPAHPTIGQVWYDTTVSSLKVFGLDSTWHKIGAGTTASGTQPSGPQQGDLWFDTSTNTLKVWNGTAFVPLGGTSSSSTAPSTPTTGQLWYDTANSQLKVWNGTAWVAVGAGSGVAAGTTPPVGATEGTLWYNTSERILYVKANVALAEDIPLYFTDWAQVWPSIQRFASFPSYNTLAARINKVIGAPSVAGASGDVADNQWGWGQTDLLEIFTNMNTPSAFDNTKWVMLISRLRKALRHTTANEASLGDIIGFINDGRGPSTAATAATPAVTWKSGWSGNGITDMSNLLANVGPVIGLLETNRFAVNLTGMQVNTIRTDATVGTTWASTRVLDVAMQFASDAAAKAFFNSGATPRFTLTLTPGSGVGFEWYNLFQTVGLNTSGLVIDHKGTKIGFAGTYGTSGTSNIGFYDFTTSFQTIANIPRGGAYGTGGLVASAKYDPATAIMTVRLSFNEDYDGGQINKLTVATDIRASATVVAGAPYLNSPAVAMPTITTSGTLLTAAQGT